MFQFSGFAFLAEYHGFTMVGCPIRKPADQSSFAAPRSLSQLITSFIASESLGIPHAPLLTFVVTRTYIAAHARLHGPSSLTCHVHSFTLSIPRCQRTSPITLPRGGAETFPASAFRTCRNVNQCTVGGRLSALCPFGRLWRITDSNR